MLVLNEGTKVKTFYRGCVHGMEKGTSVAVELDGSQADGVLQYVGAGEASIVLTNGVSIILPLTHIQSI